MSLNEIKSNIDDLDKKNKKRINIKHTRIINARKKTRK